MFSWFSNKVDPLKPLPHSKREKSYSSASGFVYQYQFKGLAGNKHVFNVTADRKSHFEVVIDLQPESLLPCSDRMGSSLRWNEEYALAKLCLFAAFDSAEAPALLRQTVVPSADSLLEHMTALNMA